MTSVTGLVPRFYRIEANVEEGAGSNRWQRREFRCPRPAGALEIPIASFGTGVLVRFEPDVVAGRIIVADPDLVRRALPLAGGVAAADARRRAPHDLRVMPAAAGVQIVGALEIAAVRAQDG